MQSRDLRNEIEANLPEFPSLLKELRIVKGFEKQSDLAERIGKSPSLINMLETGRRQPTRTIIDDISLALKLTDEEKQQLLGAAGYGGDNLTAAVNVIIANVGKPSQLDDSDRELIKDDLLTLISSWREALNGRELLVTEHLEEAQTLFTNMLRHREYSPTVRIYARSSLADIAFQLAKLRDAKKIVGQLLRNFRRFSPQWGAGLRAEALAIKAMVALRWGNFSEARKLVNQSMTLYRSSQSKGDGLAKSYKRMAQVAMFEGDLSEAMRFCEEAEESFKKLKETSKRARWLRRIRELKGWMYSKSGNEEKALAIHSQVREDSERAHDQAGVAKGWLYLADDYRRAIEGELWQAGVYETVDPLIRRDKAKAVLQTPDNLLRLENASTAYDEALPLCQQEGNTLLLGQCLRGQGIILRFKGTLNADETYYQQSQAHLEDALVIERQLNQKQLLPALYESMADLAWEWAEEGWKRRTIRYHDTALNVVDLPWSTRDDPTAQQLGRRLTAARRKLIDSLQEETSTGNSTEHPTYDLAQAIQRMGWHDYIDVGAPANWREVCEQLISGVHERLTAQGISPLTNSSLDSVWIAAMTRLEQQPGPRLLVQNELSVALSERLPFGYFAASGELHHERSRAFLESVNTLDKEQGHPCFDLCYRAVVEDQLTLATTQSFVLDRAKSALDISKAYRNGYRLEASRFSFPLAYEMKGAHILFEIPYPLAARFLPGSQQTAQYIEPLCFSLEKDSETATFLEGIFKRFEKLIRDDLESHHENSTLMWLAWAVAKSQKYIPPTNHWERTMELTKIGAM